MNKCDDVRLDIAKLIQEQDAELEGFDPNARSGDRLGFGESEKLSKVIHHLPSGTDWIVS